MRILRYLLCVLIGVLLTTGPALAQKAHPGTQYQARERSTLLEWGIGAVFLVGCLVVAFKPSKRSNLK